MAGMEVSYFPNLDTGTGDSALDKLGDLTGCWGATDRRVMAETRALDGRVESVNGRSSWTYHPDDGMSIVCNPA